MNNNLDNHNHKLNTELNDNHNFNIQKAIMKENSFENISVDQKENIYQHQVQFRDKLINLENLVNTVPRLVVEVISSTVLPPTSTLNFNAQGIENSLRNELDGYSYFGNDNYPEYVRCI